MNSEPQSTEPGREYRFDVGAGESPVRLDAHLAVPPRANRRRPGLVMCHGFPNGPMGGRTAGRSYHELTDRIAREMGWTALVFNYRGCGRSTGQFSLGNWLADTAAAIDELASHEEVSGIWVCGFGTGGALAICAAAADARVRGVAAVAPPADFTDWAAAPERLLKHAHELGIMARRDPDDFESWAAELGSIRAEACAAELAPRPLLVIHGSADEAVPVFDSRAIANSHGGADLRIIAGAGHRLRFDPRAVAILLGWLDRQRHRVGFTAR